MGRSSPQYLAMADRPDPAVLSQSCGVGWSLLSDAVKSNPAVGNSLGVWMVSMPRSRVVRPSVTVLLSVAIAAVAWPVAASAAMGASAAMCPTSGPIAENLSGVAEATSSDVWAVGSCFNGTAPQTLIEHWDGTAWTEVASPNPGGSANRNELVGVTVLSASDAWAVGFYYPTPKTLVEHWNGTSWTHVTSPAPGSGSTLNAIAATSLTNAWAVGTYNNDTTNQTLVEHWNGTKWSKVPSPSPSCPAGINLNGVAATSSSNAWAVGYCNTGSADQTLVLHWNGIKWSRAASPSPSCPAGGISLNGVSAISSSWAWVVGDCYTSSGVKTVTLRWNGTAWKRVVSPNPGGSRGSTLIAVTATSRTNVWAVGSYGIGTLTASQTLVLHWNGTAWAQVASPNPGPSGSQNNLLGIAVLSSSEAWAVGDYQPVAEGNDSTLTEHWNGTTWNHVASP
jgi:hypothetical protein